MANGNGNGYKGDPNFDLNACLNRIEYLKNIRIKQRQYERSLKARENALYSMPVVGGSELTELEANLQKFVPASHMPGNIGPRDAVVWPFYEQINFDFGTDPVLSVNNRQEQFFEVTQEAAFMILGITRSSFANDRAGGLGPYKITLRDAQSSRQLNDFRGIPFQALGTKSNPTILTTPYFLFPNARFIVEMSGFNTVEAQYDGQGIHQISFFGYRMRVDNAQAVLSTIFG